VSRSAAGIHRCRAFAVYQGREGGAAIWHLLNIDEVNQLADRPYPASQ
jgi:hypothetical protein